MLSDVILALSRKYVLDAGMKCVYAIGEKLPEREKGLEATMAVCIDQLAQVKNLLDPEKAGDLGSSSSTFQSAWTEERH